jgi:hypothetical protein
MQARACAVCGVRVSSVVPCSFARDRMRAAGDSIEWRLNSQYCTTTEHLTVSRYITCKRFNSVEIRIIHSFVAGDPPHFIVCRTALCLWDKEIYKCCKCCTDTGKDEISPSTN